MPADVARWLIELGAVRVESISDDDCRDSLRVAVKFARRVTARELSNGRDGRPRMPSVSRAVSRAPFGCADCERSNGPGAACTCGGPADSRYGASVPVGVKVGDVVIVRGGFGGEAPAPAKVEAMEVTRGARSKYGRAVKWADWSLVEANRVIFSLDNGHWCYSEQIDSLQGGPANRGRC